MVREEAEAAFRNEREKFLGFIRKNTGYSTSIDAEDVLQDVALGIFSASSVEKPVENFLAYVYASIKNRIIDIYRSSSKKKTNVSLDEFEYLTEEIDDPDSDTDEILIRVESTYRLFQALDSLNDEQREIWIATEMEGRSLSDIAREQNIPVGTLLARKHRATRKLRKLLAEFYDNMNGY